MRKTILLLAILTVPVFAADPPAGEPVHEGKKLSEWIKDLGDKDPEVRGEAGRAIGIIGPKAKAAVPSLIKALKDPDPSVRDWACYGLSNIGPAAKDAVPMLEDLMLNDKAMNVRRIAANAIGSMGADGKPLCPPCARPSRMTTPGCATSPPSPSAPSARPPRTPFPTW